MLLRVLRWHRCESRLFTRLLPASAAHPARPHRLDTPSLQSHARLTYFTSSGMGMEMPLVVKLLAHGFAKWSPKHCSGPLPVAAYCATKPMNATIAKRPFLISCNRTGARQRRRTTQCGARMSIAVSARKQPRGGWHTKSRKCAIRQRRSQGHV